MDLLILGLVVDGALLYNGDFLAVLVEAQDAESWAPKGQIARKDDHEASFP